MLKVRTCYSIVLLFVLSLGCAKRDERTLAEILRLEDRREAAAKLEPYLRYADENIQRRAVVALGKIQDGNGLPILLPLINHAKPEIRAAVVFAIGQLDDTTSTVILVTRLSEEKDSDVCGALLEALGKVGDHNAPEVVAKYLRDGSPDLRTESVLALARLAGRNIKDPRLTAMLAAAMQDEDESVRWSAAYALIRCGDFSAAPALVAALKDTSARVRMHAARALGAIGDSSAALHLSAVAKHDADWRVRINATNALGSFSLPAMFELLPVDDVNEHVRLAAITAYGAASAKLQEPVYNLDKARALDFLRDLLSGVQHGDQQHTWREYAAAAMALAQCIRGEAIEILSPHLRSSRPLLRARLAHALAETQDRRAFYFLQKLAADSILVVQLAVVEALPKLNDPRATGIYLRALGSGDEVLTATAMQNLAADSLRRRQFIPQMVEAYRRLKLPIDVEVAQIIFQSMASCGDASVVPILEGALQSRDRAFARAALVPLKTLTGKDYSDQLPAATAPHVQWTWEDIKNLSGLRATIRTEHGDIDLEFFPEDAPLTVLNFVRLAEKNFYDGLLVHRVVPNFVIQSGDPRGDMWGSPGYAIRSEFSALRYTRGTVGMASAGPDTEGAQFFIVHSEQPRLDGRYTIFARVTQGMDVVDALQVGDVIEDVAIH